MGTVSDSRGNFLEEAPGAALSSDSTNPNYREKQHASSSPAAGRPGIPHFPSPGVLGKQLPHCENRKPHGKAEEGNPSQQPAALPGVGMSHWDNAVSAEPR